MTHVFVSNGFLEPYAPTTYIRDAFAAHLSAVQTLDAAGISPPAEWRALRDRYSEFVELGSAAMDRLTQQIVNPSGGGVDLVALRANALAEQAGAAEHSAEVNERVRSAVLQKLQELYAPAAQRNYRNAAARYDDAAKRFTDLAKAIDVEADAGALLSADGRQRQAWFDAPAAAAGLEEALRPVLTAAALCGLRPDVGYLTAATDVATTEIQIALAADPGRAHRRKVWLAWLKTDGRTGRWGALAALGVKLRAAGDPTRVDPYRRPEPMVTCKTPGGKLQNWDRHDGPLPKGWHPVPVGWLAEPAPTTAAP